MALCLFMIFLHTFLYIFLFVIILQLLFYVLLFVIIFYMLLKVCTSFVTKRTHFFGRSSVVNCLDVHTKVWLVFRFEAALITLEHLISTCMNNLNMLLQRFLRLENLVAVLAHNSWFNLPLLFLLTFRYQLY